MKRNNFFEKNFKNIHRIRNKQILETHPEIKDLFGPCLMTFYYSLFIVFIQLYIAFIVSRFSMIYILLSSYFIGAILSQNLFLINHDLSHNLAFKNFDYNKMLAIFCNIPIVFPYAIIFKEYHIDHHKYLGDQIDSDIPLHLEAILFKNKIGKIIWYSNQILFYSIRPLLVKTVKINKWIIYNFITNTVSDIILYYVVGMNGILYLILSFYFAGGLNPVSAHFISEHYMLNEDIEKYPSFETYSYYGIMNLLTFNVGYHIEHHDFPNISAFNLPIVSKIAPEFYKNIPKHKSWLNLIYRFITDNRITLFNRFKTT